MKGWQVVLIAAGCLGASLAVALLRTRSPDHENVCARLCGPNRSSTIDFTESPYTVTCHCEVTCPAGCVPQEVWKSGVRAYDLGDGK